MKDFIKGLPIIIWVLSILALPVLIVCVIWGMDTKLFIKLIITDAIMITVFAIICEMCYGK